jgi:hypothetical protein
LNAPAICSGLARSQGIASAELAPCLSFISCASCSRYSVERASSASLQPSWTNRRASEAPRPDPTPAMTAIRTLEFEDEFIEISLHALPVRFRSGEGDLLSCYFGCFKNFGRRQTYFEICVRIRETDDARRFFCNESSELHFLIIHRAQSHVGNRISHFQGGGNGSACASAVPQSPAPDPRP